MVLDMRVQVYKNLHKNCYSIKALEGSCKGLVVMHGNALGLSNVSFKVYEKGRQRVLNEHQKNVHAFVVGNLEYIELYRGYTLDYPLYKQMNNDVSSARQITYNPYVHPFFYFKDDSKEIFSADECHFKHNGLWCL